MAFLLLDSINFIILRCFPVYFGVIVSIVCRSIICPGLFLTIINGISF